MKDIKNTMDRILYIGNHNKNSTDFRILWIPVICPDPHPGMFSEDSMQTML